MEAFKGDGSLWKRVLEDKYGEKLGDKGDHSGVVGNRFASMWWNDLILLQDRGGIHSFKSEVVRKMRDGMSTSFWKDRLRADVLVHDLFPLLFEISMQKDSCVGARGRDGTLCGVEAFLCGRRSFYKI